MHSEATFVYAVTGAAYFTSHLSPSPPHTLPPSSLCVSCLSLSLSPSVSVSPATRLSFHQFLCASFTYLPLSLSLLPLFLLLFVSVALFLFVCLLGKEGLHTVAREKDRDGEREMGVRERGGQSPREGDGDGEGDGGNEKMTRRERSDRSDRDKLGGFTDGRGRRGDRERRRVQEVRRR